MTWLWDIDDMYNRVKFARSQSPTDLATIIAHWIVTSVTWILSYLLYPFDYVGRLIGVLLVAVVLGFMLLLILTIIWFPLWLLLVDTSWIWLRYPWSRPLLLLPGIVVAISAHIYIMLVPDPHKQRHYVNMTNQWPLTWYIWHPPAIYFNQNHPQ